MQNNENATFIIYLLWSFKKIFKMMQVLLILSDFSQKILYFSVAGLNPKYPRMF